MEVMVLQVQLVIVKSRFPPRNTQSLIEKMEIKIGGQIRQIINNYGYIYNILNDYTTSTDAIDY